MAIKTTAKTGVEAEKPARKPRAAAAAKTPKPEKPPRAEARARFARALEEAKAGAMALRDEAFGRTDEYTTKLSGKRAALMEEAKTRGDDLKARATSLAADGKARTSGAVGSLGKMVAKNAGTIDETLGAPYGDYARKAARHIDGFAARIDAKDLAEIGDDARTFVRSSPGLALGLAAVAGFMLARMFKGDED